jgi:1-deoxy-D-xylulose-5-phosphate synthase
MDIGYLRMMPNMVLVAPADEQEIKLALEFALSQDKPVCIRYPKDAVPSDEYDRSACNEPFRLGKSIVVRAAHDAAISIVTYGPVLTQALEACGKLADDGIEAVVINARFAAPIDESILDGDRPIITVEDHGLSCGFGSSMLEEAAVKGRAGKVIVPIGCPRQIIRHDKRGQQLIAAGINVDKIVRTAKEILGPARLKGVAEGSPNAIKGVWGSPVSTDNPGNTST